MRTQKSRQADRHALEKLRAALRYGLVQPAIEEIRRRGLAAEALLILKEALREANPRIREDACLALDYLDDARATDDLRPMLVDSDPMVVVRAAAALQSFGEPAEILVPRMIDILRLEEELLPLGNERVKPPCMMLQMPEAQYHAARVLSRCGAEAVLARDELRTALSSGSAIVRTQAANALAKLGEVPATYLEPLRQALHDNHVQSSRERVWAAEALVELGEPPESVVAVLADLVAETDWTAAIRAAQALGDLGPAAKGAIPALRAAQVAGRDGVSEAATKALEQINISLLSP